ncbi:MAG: hypothetical protein IT489_06575 [Gammaproteobacteria bacterium]|nr:hypothetical protein [Gammaproteobacteria bacterium]
MTSITPPRDDEGGVRRRLQRAATAPVDKTRRVAAKAAPRPVTGQRDDAERGGDAPARRSPGPGRRQQERRRRRTVVLLDTRSPVGNRRRGTRRDDDRRLPRGEAGDPPAGAVLEDDLYA